MASPFLPRFGLTGWRYLLAFSFWTWAAGIALMVWMRADAFLLAPFLGAGAYGILILSMEIALAPVSELLEPVCATLFSGFAFARRSGSAAVSGLTVAGVLALCIIPLSIGISASAGYLVAGLLGPQWQACRPVIAVLAWICMFSPFSFVGGSVLSAHGHARRVFVCNAAAAVIKVAVVLAVRHTQDLVIIGAAGVFVVAAEAAVFIHQLHARGNHEGRQLAASMARAAISAVLTCLALTMVPGTWTDTSLGRLDALLAGGAIGVSAIAMFAGCQLALWSLAGRPAHVEARLLEVLRTALGRPLRLIPVRTRTGA